MGRGPGVTEGKQRKEGASWEPWRGDPCEEVGRGSCLNNHVLERKSLVAVGHEQNLCEGWYSSSEFKVACCPGSGMEM